MDYEDHSWLDRIIDTCRRLPRWAQDGIYYLGVMSTPIIMILLALGLCSANG
jgi:hypothetical protein